MRCRVITVCAVLAFIGLPLAFGQLPFQIPGMAGLTATDSRPNPQALLRNASVKKELRLTEDQTNKVDDAVWDGLSKVLDPEQLKRLKQIDLQQRDYMAFADPSLQKTLKLTNDQKESIKIILADADKELAGILDGVKGALTGGFAKGGLQALTSIPEKAASIRKDTRERCTDVLNLEQKRMWMEMVGEDFRLDLPKIDSKKKK
jgi:hypothetical protein